MEKTSLGFQVGANPEKQRRKLKRSHVRFYSFLLKHEYLKKYKNCKLNTVSKGNDFHESPHVKQSFMGTLLVLLGLPNSRISCAK